MNIIWVITYFKCISKILRFCQILPNFALFWQNLRDLSVTSDGRTDEEEDGRTHSSNLRLTYREGPFKDNPIWQKSIENSVFTLWRFRARKWRDLGQEILGKLLKKIWEMFKLMKNRNNFFSIFKIFKNNKMAGPFKDKSWKSKST